MAERPRVSPLFFIAVVITAAALLLGYSSYRSTQRLARTGAEGVESSARLLGRKLVDRVERLVIDTDRTFFRLVRLDDPREFVELWRRIVRVSPAVESVIVLDDRRRVRHLIAKLSRRGRRWFRRVFRERILPDMKLESLPLEQHKHLHKTYGGKTYLISYIRRRTAGRDYFIALSIDIRHLVRDVFPEEFRQLAGSHRVAVLDDGGRALYGTPVPAGPGRVFEARFATTLYKWRLQIGSPEVVAMRRQAEARQLTDLVMVAASVGVILMGLLVLVAAVRKERRAARLRSEFISNVSHELRTPLSLIRMFGELLLHRRADPAATEEYATIITRESDRLTALIDNVLDFSRIDRGKVAYDFAPGDIRRVVERAVDLCRHRAEQAGVVVDLELPPEEVRLAFDESAVTLVVLNLVENALRYGASRGGHLRVALRDEGQRVVITVADDGPGIPPDERKRVFERFYRGRDARRTSVRGSGIGLALVKHVAHAHGGRVLLESELGEGATFTVTLRRRPT